MRIAISYRQNRVSPVFDVAEHILLVDIDKGQVVRRNSRALVQTASLARARSISQCDVKVLICGVISWPLENALVSMGVQVISCICGEVEDVINAYLNEKLDEREFIMPGCLGRQERFKSKKYKSKL